VPFLSQSYHIESNKANDVCRDAGGNPLEGIRVTEDGIIRRFHNGLLDGDSYTQEGSGSLSLRLKALAILNTGGKAASTGGDLPAVSAKGFSHKEWWEHGEPVKCEDSMPEE
jgi:hypothetical protein